MHGTQCSSLKSFIRSMINWVCAKKKHQESRISGKTVGRETFQRTWSRTFGDAWASMGIALVRHFHVPSVIPKTLITSTLPKLFQTGDKWGIVNHEFKTE